jgi:chorismate dehydratase
VSPLRIGIVSFVNSRPLAWGLLRGRADASFACESLPPAVIADRLRDGSLDVGLVPSIELARIPDLEVVPGLAIAATHEVRSVLLVSRLPVAEITTVALDENSRTSAALVRILLAERYGVRPRTVTVAADLPAMLAAADAALLIGDPALAVERERFVVLDLAGEWLELTGRPFVFAVWAARGDVVRREGVSANLVAALEASFAAGWAALDEIVAETAAETGLPPPVLRDYYTRNLRYRVGPAEREGLAEFLRRAAAHGLVPAAASLRFLAAIAEIR